MENVTKRINKKKIKRRRLISGIIMLIGFVFIFKAAGETFSLEVSTAQFLIELTIGLGMMLLGLKIGGKELTEYKSDY